MKPEIARVVHKSFMEILASVGGAMTNNQAKKTLYLLAKDNGVDLPESHFEPAYEMKQEIAAGMLTMTNDKRYISYVKGGKKHSIRPQREALLGYGCILSILEESPYSLTSVLYTDGLFKAYDFFCDGMMYRLFFVTHDTTSSVHQQIIQTKQRLERYGVKAGSEAAANMYYLFLVTDKSSELSQLTMRRISELGLTDNFTMVTIAGDNTECNPTYQFYDAQEE